MVKVLHFSPVRKSPKIVKLHLKSLENLFVEDFKMDLSFFDDNVEKESSIILREFIRNHDNSFLHDIDLSGLKDFRGDERWHPILYERITRIKNRVISFFLKSDYDYLFFSDSDLIMQPTTVANLLNKKVDFISSIFWTHFDRSATYTPNAWYSKHLGFEKEDLSRFRIPGTYKVDFTGACTLLSKKMLMDGVSFQRIPVLNYLGEDKHFCIRASALGYDAYVNSEFPAFHLYKPEDVKMGETLLRTNFQENYLVDWLNTEWEKKVEKWLNPRKTLLQKIKRKFL